MMAGNFAELEKILQFDAFDLLPEPERARAKAIRAGLIGSIQALPKNWHPKDHPPAPSPSEPSK